MSAVNHTALPRVPAAFFGIVLGVVGLGNTWRAATKVWHLPALVGEALLGLGTLIWLALVILYALKWVLARSDALSEARNPIQCCFIGLAGVSTMLVGIAFLPYARPVAEILYLLGAAFTLAFAIWRTGLLWQGDRDTARRRRCCISPLWQAGLSCPAARARSATPIGANSPSA